MMYLSDRMLAALIPAGSDSTGGVEEIFSSGAGLTRRLSALVLVSALHRRETGNRLPFPFIEQLKIVLRQIPNRPPVRIPNNHRYQDEIGLTAKGRHVLWWASGRCRTSRRLVLRRGRAAAERDERQNNPQNRPTTHTLHGDIRQIAAADALNSRAVRFYWIRHLPNVSADALRRFAVPRCPHGTVISEPAAPAGPPLRELRGVRNCRAETARPAGASHSGTA